MNLDNFSVADYYLLRSISDETSLAQLQQELEQYSAYASSHTSRMFHLGISISLQNPALINCITDWASKISSIQLFHFFELFPHQKISDLLENQTITPSQKIHVLPHPELNYGRFKDELWDLHIEGYQVYFHHVNEVKSFTKNLDIFQKLTNRGVIVGITACWKPSWLGNDVQKIQSLIRELSIHFFNTQNIDVESEPYLNEQTCRVKILEMEM